MKVSERVSKMLTDAGWFDGRSVKDMVDDWREKYLLIDKVEIPHYAESVLMELGGLTLKWNSRTERLIGDQIIFGPKIFGLVLGIQEDTSDFAEGLFHVGGVRWEQDGYSLAVDPNGGLWFGYGEVQRFFKLGDDLFSSLDNFCVGKVIGEFEIPEYEDSVT